MSTSYTPSLVILSYLVATCASYMTLKLVERVRLAHDTKDLARFWWLSGACVMGGGIWSMHFIGMLAYNPPYEVSYSLGVTLLSMWVAILASAAALKICSRPQMSRRHYIVGGTLLGLGIAAMHYIGMAAMEMDVVYGYTPSLVLVSIAIAILAATTALWLSYFFSGRVVSVPWRYKLISAAVMGAGICGMHYVGMAAVVVSPEHALHPPPMSVQEQGQGWLAVLVAMATLFLLGATLLIINAQVRWGRWLETRLQATSSALATERVKVSVMLDSIAEGVVTTDAQGYVTHLNPIAENLLGVSRQNACEQPLEAVCQLLNEVNRESVEGLGGILEHGDVIHYSTQTLLRSLNGKEYYIDYKASPVKDEIGVIVGAVIVMRDVTYRHKVMRKLHYQAKHDALTGLLNRRAFDHILNEALAKGGKNKSPFLLYIDLDYFKAINDNCGHAVGDEVLKYIANILRDSVPRSSAIVRLGGDEFAIAMFDCTLDEAQLSAEAIRDRISAYQHFYAGKAYSVGASIGVVRVNDIEDSTRILSAADSACYLAKRDGRNRVKLYHKQDGGFKQQSNEVKWLPLLKEALEENRFVLYIQEIISACAKSSNEKHYEILLRYVDDEGLHVAPMAFIPAAERFSLMPQIDRWVVCNTFRLLNADDCRLSETCMFSINLSAQSLADEDFPDFIEAQLEEWSITPASICFEITEKAAISDLDGAQRFIYRLRQLGCKFSLDDFGSGMSSFAYLRNLPVSYLKIDGLFVKNMMNTEFDVAIVSSICSIGRTLGISTVAEYVESKDIIDKLRLIGVDYVQGFGIGCPRPITTLLPASQSSSDMTPALTH